MFNSFKKIFNGASAGFITAIIIAIISSINTILFINRMQNDLQTMYEKDLIGQNNIQIARVNLIYLDREIKELILQKDYEAQNKSLDNINGYRQNILEHISIAEPTYTGRNKQFFKEMKNTHDDYMKLLESNIYKIKELKNAKVAAEIINIDNEMKTNFVKLDNLLNRLDDIKQQKDIRIYKNIIVTNNITLIITILVLFGTIGVRFILYLIDKRKNQVVCDCDKKLIKNK
jgi:Four helix bundle sensory module for signal transduction